MIKNNFKELSYDKFEDNYEILSNYIDNKTPILIKCNIHNFIKNIIPKSHLKSKYGGCPYCDINKINKFNFKSIFNKIHNNLYNYDETNYINARSNINITCNIHGEFIQNVSSHLKGSNCPDCYIEFRKLKFIEKANYLHNKIYNYSMINYVNNKTKIEIICKKHGKFKQRPNNHLNGEGCPKCNNSKGEKIILNILEDNYIKYEYQKKFKDCKYKYTLRFDFYLPEYNTCIEYDGVQHFKSIKIFGGDNNLKYNIIKDNIKNKWCLNNSINIIRIPYLATEEDIKYEIEKIKLNICTYQTKTFM